jgi:succinate-semialdehyde dehydrogenase/glutarate-semialdehyde dehydrogenase
MMNAGQVCIAAKRFIVEESIAEKFTAMHSRFLQQLKLGDPMSKDTDIGPIARKDLLDTIEEQVNRSVDMGATLVTGGTRIDDVFYVPTLLTNVTGEMPVISEETFGPVSVILNARDADHALELANDSIFGLGASIWTTNYEKAEQMAESIEAGAVFINGMTKSDPRLPFGGIKQSGYGRELSYFGIREFVNAKSIWMK